MRSSLRRIFLALLLCRSALGQTTGSVTGVVRDVSGAVLAGIEVQLTETQTAVVQRFTTDAAGGYRFFPLLPGQYSLTAKAAGFAAASINGLSVQTGRTTHVDLTLNLAAASSEVLVRAMVSAGDTPVGTVALDGITVAALPLATRNPLQLAALSAGASTYLPDATLFGRGNQVVLVNGARATQNTYEVNGVAAGSPLTHGPEFFAAPPPETLSEMTLQNSLGAVESDRGAGGVFRFETYSGGDDLHGSTYEYFHDDALNANRPELRAAGAPRPELKGNVYGATLGGPIRKKAASFFLSYQGTRDRNAADQGVYSNVRVASGLTDDRSPSTLSAAFSVPQIHPAALALLNARLPNGDYVIPTPGPDGSVSGSVVADYREEQFNANLDLRPTARDMLSARAFFSNAWGTRPLVEANVPGFPGTFENTNRVISIHQTRTLSITAVNNFVAGYSHLRGGTTPVQPLLDSDLGIARVTGDIFPGLPQIAIARPANGVVVGSPASDTSEYSQVLTLTDTASLQRGRHVLTLSADAYQFWVNVTGNAFNYGTIEFQSFEDFLAGKTSFSFLGSGPPGGRRFCTSKVGVFLNNTWRGAHHLAVSSGLRYQLTPAPYETRGRYGNFVPEIYRPPIRAGELPSSGIVRAANSGRASDLPGIPSLNRRMIRTDLNDFAPHLAFSWAPKDWLELRSGYGIVYSPVSFRPMMLTSVLDIPFFDIATAQGLPFDHPFPTVLRPEQFPALVPGDLVAGFALDRRLRTPYAHQFNMGAHAELSHEMRLEVGYQGARGVKLYRDVAANLSRLASPAHPVINAITGEVITTNTVDNALLRAPFQGAAQMFFLHGTTSARSSYDALQITVSRTFTSGLQFLSTYTWAKSIDDNSGSGGGSGQSRTLALEGESALPSVPGHSVKSVSDFDRAHRVTIAFLAPLPSRGSGFCRTLSSGWSLSGIAVGMSGLPVDVIDSNAGTIYGVLGGRANIVATPAAAPRGYFFNPFAFASPQLRPGQAIGSSGGTAVADDFSSDLGNVPRNLLRAGTQVNIDLAVSRHLALGDRLRLELRTDAFNVLNHNNPAEPITDVAAAAATGVVDSSGRILSPGNFGRVLSTNGNPRLLQLAIKISF